jgi:hypothetical protein
MNLRVLGVVLVVVLSLGVPSGLFADSLVGAGSGSVNLGNIFSIPVSISNVSDLYAFQFDLSFDPAVLELLGITEGAFLPTAGATSFSPGAIDNLAGTATFTADSVVGPVPGASGSGDLAWFEFKAIGFVSSNLTLSNVILLDSSLTDIAFTTQDGKVDVLSEVVPEPATLPLVGAAFCTVLAILFRRRRAVIHQPVQPYSTR